MIVNSILKISEANGPGKRGVVWVQGCPRKCDGCFNKETQPFDGGKEMSIDSIVSCFDFDSIEGFTVSGGEPFCQPEELYELLKMIKSKGLNTLVYSGFTYEELKSSYFNILCQCDYLIDGSYIKDFPSKCKWAGSGNQRFLKLKDGNVSADLTESEEYSQSAEIIINEKGEIIITGFMNEKSN